MADKKRKSARAVRDRKRLLSRYYRVHGYGRFRSEFEEQKTLHSMRYRIIFGICAFLVLGIGLFYVIF